jgi:hypothetical protein
MIHVPVAAARNIRNVVVNNERCDSMIQLEQLKTELFSLENPIKELRVSL